MKVKRRWNYFVYCALRDRNLCTADDSTYEEKIRDDGSIKKSIVVEYEDTDEVKAVINEAFESRGLKRKSGVAKVNADVKAATVKAEVESKTEEIKEEPAMSEVTFTAAQVAALLAATATTAPATKIEYKEIVKEVVPSDYDQLKKDLETAKKTASTWQSKASELEKQIAELKAQLAASSKVDTHVPTLKEDLADEKFEQEVKDSFDSPFNDDFCDFNKAINLVAEAEARKEKKKADAAEEAKRKGIVTKYFDAYSAFHFVKGNLDYIKNACPDKKKWQSFADEIENYDCFTAEEITFVRDVAYGC